MTQLAVAAPKKRGIGPLMTGTVAQESVSVNKWNLDALSVNEKHIAPASISTEKLVIGSVTAVTIADGTITGDKVAAATITGNKISANTITGSNVQAGTITSTQIYGDTLAAISADLGTITAGTLNLISGTTGVYLSPTQILAQVSGTPKLDFNTGTGLLYVAGEIMASKITITSNAANSVVFGTDIVIEGDIDMTSTATDHAINFDTSPVARLYYSHINKRIYLTEGNSTGSVYLFGGSTYGASIHLQGGASASSIDIGTSGGSRVTTTLACGDYSSTQKFYLKRGSTTVMSFAGNSNTVTFAGAGVFGGLISSPGVCSFSVVEGNHKTAAGNQLANGTYTWGGSLTFTMTDGLITATNAVGPT